MKKIIIIAITTILCSIIIGGSFYAVQINKQDSIERQQQIELQAKTSAEQTKNEQDKKEYVVKRKKDCYDLEASERKKFSNVDGSYYNEEKDVCVVRYIDEKWKGGSIMGEWDETLKIFIGGKYFTKEF